MSSSLEVVRSVKLGILVPTNLIGNILVVLVVMRTRNSLQTPMNYLLVNLAFADVTVAVFMVIDQLFFHVVHHPEGVAGDILCKLLTGKILTWVGSLASVCTLVVIAFERFYAIVLPYKHTAKLTKRKTVVTVVFCWIIALTFNLPLLIVRKLNLNIKETGFFCRSYWPSKQLAIAYNFLWLVFVGVVPVGLMAVLYGRIVFSLWFHQNSVTNEAQKARLKSRKRVTKMLVTLSVIYAVCWFPNLLINTIDYYIEIPALRSIGYLVSEMLVLLNSSINPFVYALQSKQFREAIKTIVCCREGGRVMPLVAATRNVTTLVRAL